MGQQNLSSELVAGVGNFSCLDCLSHVGYLTGVKANGTSAATPRARAKSLNRKGLHMFMHQRKHPYDGSRRSLHTAYARIGFVLKECRYDLQVHAGSYET